MWQNFFMALLLDRHDTALAAVRALGVDALALAALDDTALLQLARLSGQLSRLVGANAAVIAGEIERRSARSLGGAGLAQAAGFRTPQELVRTLTGSTKAEASQAVAVGRITTGHDPRPWLASVGAAVRAGSLSPASARAIAAGLAGTAVPDAELGGAAAQLVEEAADLDADRLFARARQLRDELDEAGIANREAALRERRSLRFHRRPDGMSHLSWDLDPETAAHISDLYDRATSPRRGGPRFTDASPDGPDAARIADDPRSTDQLASDVFADLLRAGADADSSQLLGSGAPAVRVIVAATALASGTGHGRIEGQTEPVSIETVERLACAGATTAIRVDSTGQPLDLGREQRLYTRQQRIALAVRDGGCRWPGCERPPSWTEAHHVKHWQRDRGSTDIANGVLLCRHHHLLVHNNRWKIEKRGSQLWLIPPEKDGQALPMRDPSVLGMLSA